MNGNQFIGMRVSEFQRYNDIGPIMGVAVIVDDEHEYQYPLRDTLGPKDYVLEVTCPYGSQAMAQTIYNSVAGKVYKGFSAQNAPLALDAELGDAITVKDTYSMLAYQSLEFGPGHMSEVAAPGDNELENEYPWLISTQKEFDRVLATTRSQIKKTSEQIMLEVIRVEGNVETLSSRLTIEVDKIEAEIADNVNNINTRLTLGLEGLEYDYTNKINGIDTKFTAGINGLESSVRDINGNISTIEQRFDKIKLSVSGSGGITNSISITTDGIHFSAVSLDFSGLVTFSDLSNPNSKTIINGANIQTGKIDAQYLNLTGAITFSDLSSSVQNDIDDAYDMASSANRTAKDVGDTLDELLVPGTTYIDGTRIESGTVTANYLEGNYIYIYRGNTQVGVLNTRATTSSYGTAVELESYDSLSLIAADRVWIANSNGTSGILFDGSLATVSGDIGAAGNGASDCGTSRNKWNDVWAVNGEIQTSDRNEKTDIEYGLEKYDLLFDNLKPCTFRFRDGTRIHQGMIAQDVEDEIDNIGIDSKNFAAFIKFNKTDEDGNNVQDEYGYALRYTEFIPTLIWQVQQLKKRVNELERIVS